MLKLVFSLKLFIKATTLYPLFNNACAIFNVPLVLCGSTVEPKDINAIGLKIILHMLMNWINEGCN